MVENKKLDRLSREVRDELISRLSGDAHIVSYLAVHWHRYRDDIRQTTARMPEGGSVLDLGAYPFCVPETLARLGYNVTAAGLSTGDHNDLDLSFDIIEVDCDREPLPFPDKHFDAVIFSEIFEHLYVNPLRAIEEIHRVLKPGGFIYLTTPNALGLRRLVRTAQRGTLADDAYNMLKGIKAGGVIGHYREYTPREIDRIIRMTGFSKVETTTVNPYRKQFVETWFWRIITALLPKMRENITTIAFKESSVARSR